MGSPSLATYSPFQRLPRVRYILLYYTLKDCNRKYLKQPSCCEPCHLPTERGGVNGTRPTPAILPVMTWSPRDHTFVRGLQIDGCGSIYTHALIFMLRLAKMLKNRFMSCCECWISGKKKSVGRSVPSNYPIYILDLRFSVSVSLFLISQFYTWGFYHTSDAATTTEISSTMNHVTWLTCRWKEVTWPRKRCQVTAEFSMVVVCQTSVLGDTIVSIPLLTRSSCVVYMIDSSFVWNTWRKMRTELTGL